MLETLYFFCYYAFLLGDLAGTKMYYEILRDEFKSTGSITALKNHQMAELRRIQVAIKNGCIPSRKWLTNPSSILPPAGAPSTARQDDLVRNIGTKGLPRIRELFEDAGIELYNIEHPCPPYGAVDMVFRSHDTAYPIEVKKDCGEHDLIGQIGKYDLFHKMQLHHKFYEQVQSATICRTYQPYALRELKSMGIETLLYSDHGGVITIERI